MPFLSAYESNVQTQFATQNAADSSFATAASSIATAVAAGQYSIQLSTPTPGLIQALRDNKYEVNPLSPQTPQNATTWVVSWSAPRD